MVHYGMTKAAQIAIARGIAETVAGTGITVNSVLPGPTKSRGVGDFVESLAKEQGKSAEQFEKEFFAHVRPTSLIKRFATTQEVAAMVAYVASPLASATTGASCASMAARSRARSEPGGITMLRLLIPVLLIAAAIGAVTLARRARRRADTTPDLHQHPERLTEELDSSDDA